MMIRECLAHKLPEPDFAQRGGKDTKRAIMGPKGPKESKEQLNFSHKILENKCKKNYTIDVINRFLNKDDMVEEAIEMLRHKLNRFPRVSKEQLQRIENAKKEFEEGNYLTNSQVDKIVDEWLKCQ